MKSVLLAMTEEDHDKRSWRCSALVAAFLVVSLALNAVSREQSALVRHIFDDSNDTAVLLFVGAFTAAQILLLAFTLQPLTSRGELPNKEALVVIAVSHVGGVFLHDFLASFGTSENSLSASFSMPLLTLLALWLVTSVMPRLNAVSSIVVVTLGCIFMSLRMSSVVATDRTSLISALCVFSLSLRNIVIRQLVAVENVSIKLRSSFVISGVVCACVTMVFGVYMLSSLLWVTPLLCALLTCALSCALFYLSTQLLRTYGVLLVSLFHTWAVLIEAVILTPVQHRPDLVMCIVALGLVLIGHYLFFKDHMDSSGPNAGSSSFSYSKPANTHEQYTRIEFLLFFCFVLGVIFYVFQPKVSQRDLKTLSYVGLDRVIRRLLSVPEELPAH